MICWTEQTHWSSLGLRPLLEGNSEVVTGESFVSPFSKNPAVKLLLHHLNSPKLEIVKLEMTIFIIN